jgi:hypothetical protein
VKLLEKINKISFLILGIVIIFNSFFLTLPVNAQSLVPSKSEICGGPCPLFDSDFTFDSEGIVTFLLFFARFLTYIGVGLAVLFLVIAGLQFITGNGDAAAINIKTTLIGLVVIIVAYTFVSLLTTLLVNGDFGDLFDN